MINSIYEILKTILNKELRGNVTPAEFNLIAKQVQEEIYRGYFEDYNRDKNRQNRGLTNLDFANLPFSQRQRIEKFQAKATLAYASPNFTLPADIYMLKHNGLDYNGNVIEEMPSSGFSYMVNSLAGPSTTFPVYEMNSSSVTIYPATIIDTVTCRYLRKPLDPNWTYTVVSGRELFNGAAGDFQDFELAPAEFSNIVIRMLSLFGINLRETEVAQYAESQKKATTQREES